MQQENIGLKLLEARLITPEALQKAQLQIKTGGGHLTGALVKIGALAEEDLSKFLSEFYGVPSVDLSNLNQPTQRRSQRTHQPASPTAPRGNRAGWRFLAGLPPLRPGVVHLSSPRTLLPFSTS